MVLKGFKEFVVRANDTYSVDQLCFFQGFKYVEKKGDTINFQKRLIAATYGAACTGVSCQ
jgi:hypothetical protein